jgi:hypothetical protein
MGLQARGAVNLQTLLPAHCGFDRIDRITDKEPVESVNHSESKNQ